MLAGEASGDDRGAELIQALRKKNPSLRIAGMGGPKMKAAGMEALADVTGEAVVGFFESVRRYPFFKKIFDRLLAECAARRPAAVVGIDYPGFNLRFEKAVRWKLGKSVKIIHYVSPQIWAWREGRKHRMAEFLDLVLCLFPFEPQVYADTGLRAEYVGHPLPAQIPAAPSRGRDPNLVALLPGSRSGEIGRHWPVLRETALRLAKTRPSLRFAVGSNDGRRFDDFEVRPARELMAAAQAGIVALGTATLESALHGMPMVVVYKVSTPTYLVSKPLIKLQNLAMPSVIAGRRIVPEFIQGRCCPEALVPALEQLLDSAQAREEMAAGYRLVRERFGEKNAADNAAGLILESIGSPRG